MKIETTIIVARSPSDFIKSMAQYSKEGWTIKTESHCVTHSNIDPSSYGNPVYSVLAQKHHIDHCKCAFCQE